MFMVNSSTEKKTSVSKYPFSTYLNIDLYMWSGSICEYTCSFEWLWYSWKHLTTPHVISYEEISHSNYVTHKQTTRILFIHWPIKQNSLLWFSLFLPSKLREHVSNLYTKTKKIVLFILILKCLTRSRENKSVWTESNTIFPAFLSFKIIMSCGLRFLADYEGAMELRKCYNRNPQATSYWN